MTKKQKEWNHLKEKGSITSEEAIRLYRHTRLADYIFRWRKKGIIITDKREKNDRGESWVRYCLDPKEAKRAEQEGLV